MLNLGLITRKSFTWEFQGKTLILLSLAITAVSFVAPIFALSLLLAMITGLFLSWRRFTFIESLFLAWASVAMIHIILYSIVTALGLHLDVRLALPVEATIASIIFVVWTRRRKNIPIQGSWCNVSDLGAFLASAATFCLLLIPIINAGAGSIAQFLSYGEDNASHYAINRYILEHGDLSYKQKPSTTGLIPSLVIYPQGFHINDVIDSQLTAPKDLGEGGFLKAHALFITLQYALLIFWLVKASLAIKSKVHTALIAAVVPGITLLGGMGLFLLLLFRGSQPQIYAYMFLALFIYLIGNTSGKENNQAKLRIVYASIFFFIGIASSWWLILPIGGLTLLFYINQEKLWIPLWKERQKYLIAKALVIFAIMYPILITFLLSTKADPLNEPGGVDRLGWPIFLYLAPVIVIATAFLWRTMKAYMYLYITLAGALLLAIAIGAYNKFTVGQFEYYFYKSMYTVLFVILILFVISALHVGQLAYERLGTKAKYLLLAGIVGATVGITAWTQLVQLRVYIHNWLPNAVQPGDMNGLFFPSANNYDDQLFIGGCEPARDYLRNRWTGARFLSENYTRNKLEIAALTNNTKQSHTLLPRYLKQHQSNRIHIVVSCSQGKLLLPKNLSAYPGVSIEYQ